MKHVAAIEKLIEDGAVSEAFESLEQLLALGPNNVHALKLLASLYLHQGRFDEEADVWRQIIEIDGEDEEATEFFQKAQIEDREHYYFTDLLPDGGRRFIAYPRSLIQVSLLGLVGCIGFLMLTRFAASEQVSGSPFTIMTAFIVMVITPWLAIVYTWAKSLRSVNISSQKIVFSTRFRSFGLNWQEVEKISLAHSGHPGDAVLKLVVIPKTANAKKQAITVDFTESRSPIRARRYLINEIKSYQKTISHDVLEHLKLEKDSTINL